jgi:hypothetical protein
MLLAALPSVYAEDYTIDGDSVYVDNSNIYLSVTPHTLTSDGYQTVLLTSKQFGGDIDIAVGFDSEGTKPTSIDNYAGGEWNTISNIFNRVNYDYSGYDAWYVAKNININQGEEYTTRIYTDVKLNSEGKYFICLKPSSKTISQAVSDGQYYCLDPWYNLSCDTRRNVTYGSTGIPFSVNDNNTVLDTNIMFTVNNTVDEPLFVYSNCTDGAIRIGNLTDEKAYENTSIPGVDGVGSNNPTDVYNSSFRYVGHLDDGLNVNDSSPSNNDGNLTAGASSVTGLIGSAILLDSDAQEEINMGSDSSLDIGTNDFTFLILFRTSSESTKAGSLIGKTNDHGVGTPGADMYIGGTDQLKGYISDGATRILTANAGPEVDDGEWHCAAVVRTGDNLHTYLDNIRIASLGGASGLDVDSPFDAKIGARNQPTLDEFNGTVDEPRYIIGEGYTTEQIIDYCSNSRDNLTSLVEQKDSIELTVVSPTNDSVITTDTLNVSFIVTDNTGSGTIQGQVWIVNASGNFSVGTNISIISGETGIITAGPLSEETFELFVEINTTSGANINSSFITVTFDITAPPLTVDSPLNITYATTNIELNVSSNETNETFWYQYNDNGTNITFIPNTTFFAGGGDGPKNITIYVNDSGGNENFTTVFFTLDVSPPLVNIVQPENITYTTTSVRFLANTTSSDAESWLYWLEVNGVNITSNISYVANDNISLKNLLSIDRTYTIHVFLNDTNGNVNHSSVIFTIDPDANITIEPTTPGSGGGGGYSVDLDFTADITAATAVDGYQPFNVRATLSVTDTSVNFSTPVIVFVSNDIVVGTWNMHYVKGSDNNITYERTIRMPPGVYTYYIETTGSNGFDYFSEELNLNVRVPTNENLTGLVLPSDAYTGLLVTFTDATTPRSHDRINRIDGIYISGLALNVNGTLTNATLFIMDEDGTEILINTDLDFADNGDGTYMIFGFSPLPANTVRVSILIGVEDSTGAGAYSVNRKLILLDENSDHIFKQSLVPFINPFGMEFGEGLTTGKMFGATIIMMALIGGLYVSGAGTIPAVAFGIIAAIEFATFQIVPTWVSIIGGVLLGLILMKDVLAIWLRR